jgi:transposase
VSEEVIRYSEAFKLHVVGEIESGRFRSQNEAREFYGLGAETVRRWLMKYGRNRLLKKVVRVETPDEKSQVKKLQQRIRDLEQALADAKLAELMERSFLEVACRDLGCDITVFKKNADTRRFMAGS